MSVQHICRRTSSIIFHFVLFCASYLFPISFWMSSYRILRAYFIVSCFRYYVFYIFHFRRVRVYSNSNFFRSFSFSIISFSSFASSIINTTSSANLKLIQSLPIYHKTPGSSIEVFLKTSSIASINILGDTLCLAIV